MGLLIKVLQPIEKATEQEWELANNVFHIYSLDFYPIKHLAAIPEGYYRCKAISAPQFHTSYGAFSELRNAIAYMVANNGFRIMNNFIEHYAQAPFIEMLRFADNEGSFDYLIATKLYLDFLNHRTHFKRYVEKNSLDKLFLDLYDDYMEICRIAAENRAVVFYC